MVQGLMMTRSKKSLSRHQNNIGFWINKNISVYDNVGIVAVALQTRYVFDCDPSSGTVLNQLNLPVLFLLLTALWLCFRVSFSSVLYQQLCQGFSAASKNVPQESTLMTTTRNRRIYLWWLVGWRRDVTKKFRSACENKIVPNTIIFFSYFFVL